MNCTHCGAPLEDGVAFCTNCGQKVETPAADAGPVSVADFTAQAPPPAEPSVTVYTTGGPPPPPAAPGYPLGQQGQPSQPTGPQQAPPAQPPYPQGAQPPTGAPGYGVPQPPYPPQAGGYGQPYGAQPGQPAQPGYPPQPYPQQPGMPPQQYPGGPPVYPGQNPYGYAPAQKKNVAPLILGIIGLVFSLLIPLVAYCTAIPGLALTLRDRKNGRPVYGAALPICIVAIVIAVINHILSLVLMLS